MDVQTWQWLAFGAAVLVLVALDMLAMRGSPAHRMRRALVWSGVWLAVGLGFTALVWASAGGGPAGEYVTGYLIERTLSLDNVFVIALILGALHLSPAARGWALTWGILVALALRAVMIAGGASLLGAASWVAYLFAGFLIVSGLRMAAGRAAEIHPERSRLLDAARRRLHASPLVAAGIGIATADLVFALDSIPSIFAITRETFLVVAANALALLGLRSLYELLTGMVERFRYLNVGLGAVLVVVGAKMAAADIYHVPAAAMLVAVVAIVGAAIAASLYVPPPRAERGRTKGPAHALDA